MMGLGLRRDFSVGSSAGFPHFFLLWLRNKQQISHKHPPRALVFHRIAWQLISGIVLLLACNFVVAQSSGLADVIGIPSDAAVYPIPGVGFVNLKTGNLHLEIPVRSVKDRNGKSITTNITYDSSVWQLIDAPGPNGGTIGVWAAWPTLSQYQWQSSLVVTQNPNNWGQVRFQPTPYECGSSQIQQWTNFQYVDGHGTIHNFPPDVYTEAGGPGITCPDLKEAHVAASDGSGYWLDVTNYTDTKVYDMHGDLVTGGGVDSNGNIPNPNLGGFRDFLGRQLSLPSGFVFSYKRIDVWTSFTRPDGQIDSGQMNTTTLPDNLAPHVISSLTLPDGRKYSFQYDDAGNNPGEQGHYGALTGITLPTGGQITIVNQQVDYGFNTTSGLVVKQIATPDGTWSFSYQAQGAATATAPMDPASGLASQTTLTYSVAPDGVTTVGNITTYPGAAGGTPLLTIATQNPDRPTDIAVTNSAGQTKHVSYSYVDQRCTPRISARREYDFSGSLVRETDVSYFTTTSDNNNLCTHWSTPPTWSSSYTQAHIIDIPQSVKIYGPAGSNGTPVAETDFTYDSTPLSTTSGSAGNSVLGLPIHDDVHYGPSMTVRGNLTAVSQMASPGVFINTKTNYYNVLGDLVQTKDGKGNATNYDYTDSWNDSACISGPAFAYPTTITNALSQLVKSKYNSCDGTTAAVQDQNDLLANRPGTVYSYDGLQRITNVSLPDTGNTSKDYGGSNLPEVITTTTIATPSPTQISTQTLDSLGRPTQTVGANGAKVDPTYDPLGRVRSVSNPYFATTDYSYGVTSYRYDALGRKTLQCQPDNGTGSNACAPGTSYLEWVYNGNVMEQYDELRNHMQYTYDGLGRLTKVLEPDPSTNTPSLQTDYQYDTLDNLTLVIQWGGAVGSSGARVRQFSYDSLSRILTATNPESGTICYGAISAGNCSSGYDANGNLTAKTDARGVSTYYSYDALNRLVSKTYSDATPPVVYHYDEATVAWAPYTFHNTVGRLSSAEIGGPQTYSKYAYDYDPNGRLGAKAFLLPNQTGDGVRSQIGITSEARDLNGGVTWTDDGTGRYLSLTRDAAGHVTSVTSNFGTTALLNGVSSHVIFQDAHYDAYGHMNNRTLGNGLRDGSSYDNRGRLVITAQLDASGHSVYTTNPSYQKNGNIDKSYDSVNGSWTYQYDRLNRLKSQTQYGTGFVISWDYDPFGNRLSQSASGNGYAPQIATLPDDHNRIDQSAGVLYDNAGNMIFDNLGTAYTYDAEGRISTSGSGGATKYLYDSEGRLIYENGPSGIQVRRYDVEGQMVSNLAEFSPTGQPFLDIRTYVDGELIGSLQNSAYTWIGKDWLGTKRFESRGKGDVSSGAIYYNPQTYTSLPFGDALSGIGQDPIHFTGKERDIESGLDYFGARYYASSMGRMMSPDWSAKAMPIPYAKLDDPQSLNLYSYVRNNPLSRTDPTGHYVVNCPVNDKGCIKGINNFEKQRQKDLKSKDANVRAGAASWGDKGVDNGVSVTFKPQAQVNADAGVAGTVNGFVQPGVTDDHKPQIIAEFSESRTGSDLAQTIVHEGIHVGDDLNFINSYNPATGKYNEGFNFTHGDAEFRAFEAGSGVKPYPMFTPGPGGYDQLQNYFQNSPAYRNVLDQVLFPGFPTEYPK